MSVGKHIRFVAVVATFFYLVASAHAGGAGLTSSSLLDSGYRDMYNLQFEEAHHAFAEWQKQHPQDPLGPASDAAAYLFAEFNRLHVLEFELFTDDHKLAKQPQLPPDPAVRQAFEAQLARTRKLAEGALQKNPHDANAQFAQVLRLGLLGD